MQRLDMVNIVITEYASHLYDFKMFESAKR